MVTTYCALLLLVVGGAEQRLARLVIALHAGGRNFRHLLPVSPAGEADLVSGVVGVEQQHLLRHIHVRHYRPVDDELILLKVQLIPGWFW